MATIKAYSDLEQSCKLAEILPLESADYFHAPDAGIVVTEPYKLNEDDETVITAYKGAIPCWSLAALLSVLPLVDFTMPQLIGTPKTLYRCIYNDDLKSHAYDNPVDACYELILKLNELNLL